MEEAEVTGVATTAETLIMGAPGPGAVVRTAGQAASAARPCGEEVVAAAVVSEIPALNPLEVLVERVTQ